MDSRPFDSNPNYTTLNTTTTPHTALLDSFDEQQERLSTQHPSQSLDRNPSVSTAGSYSHRDSRVQSIYDRYLYRQESQKVVRNLSTKSPGKKLKRLTSIKEKMSSSPSTKKKRHSMASRKDNRESRPENSAWAGMMMGNISSDESDSDDSDREIKAPAPASSKSKDTSPAKARASWSSRAVAVGSRPPDSASQNPPTLKLLGLKSVKEGGAPIGFSSSHLDVKQHQLPPPRNVSPPFDLVSEDSRSDRIMSTSDYGDDAGRHGSYIDFGGAAAAASKTQARPSRGHQSQEGPSNMASSSLEAPTSASARGAVSPRTALTQQLGLATPQQSPSRLDQESTGYFPPQPQPSRSPPRNLLPGSQNRPPQSDRSPQAPSPVVTPTSAQPIPLQRGGPPPPSPGFSAPPGYAMQPPPNSSQMRSAAPAPMPIPLPSPVYPPSSGPMMANHPPSSYQRPSNDNRSAAPASGPGFSDSPQVGGRQMARRQPSLLRRSMAFITGNDPMNPHQRQPSAGGANGQKKGLFRRSLAILTNRPIQPTAIPVNDYCDSPLPRVAGFIDEKPKNRKSEYLGASGMGDEWDYSGYGAKFWRRFSVAQRREMEGANKDSEAFRKKMARRRQFIIMMSLLGGLAIIGGVAAVIIWRESVPAAATPGAVDRQKDGVVLVDTPAVNGGSTTATHNAGYISAAASTPAVVQDAAVKSTASTTTRRHHHHNADNRKRAAAVATPVSPVVEQIKREVLSTAPSYYGGVHPLPRSLLPAGDLIRRRMHSDRAVLLAPEAA